MRHPAPPQKVEGLPFRAFRSRSRREGFRKWRQRNASLRNRFFGSSLRLLCISLEASLLGEFELLARQMRESVIAYRNQRMAAYRRVLRSIDRLHLADQSPSGSAESQFFGRDKGHSPAQLIAISHVSHLTLCRALRRTRCFSMESIWRLKDRAWRAPKVFPVCLSRNRVGFRFDVRGKVRLAGGECLIPGEAPCRYFASGVPKFGAPRKPPT